MASGRHGAAVGPALVDLPHHDEERREPRVPPSGHALRLACARAEEASQNSVFRSVSTAFDFTSSVYVLCRPSMIRSLQFSLGPSQGIRTTFDARAAGGPTRISAARVPETVSLGSSCPWRTILVSCLLGARTKASVKQFEQYFECVKAP